MKKLVFIFYILSCCLSLTAQDNQQSDSIKNKELPVVMFSYKDYVRKSSSFYPQDYFCIEEENKNFWDNFTPVILPEYFFIGTLNPIKRALRENEVNRYEKEEKPLVEYLGKYIQQTLDIQITISEEKLGSQEIISIYSPELIEIRNHFFNEKTGALKENLFNTDEEIASYILGVYYRFGKKTEEENFYQIGNLNIYIGEEKMYSLLKKVRVKKILYLNTSKNRYPSAKITIEDGFSSPIKFLFEPSLFLKKYLDTIEEEKGKFRSLYLDFL